jgi:hypothetical protein
LPNKRIRTDTYIKAPAGHLTTTQKLHPSNI